MAKRRKKRTSGKATEAFLQALGENIKTARSQGGLTQSDLAAAANVHQPTLQRIEAGKAEPSLVKAWRLADALGVSVDDFRPKMAT
jgi:transcriptional regulator with XRE-family HTH domain